MASVLPLSSLAAETIDKRLIDRLEALEARVARLEVEKSALEARAVAAETAAQSARDAVAARAPAPSPHPRGKDEAAQLADTAPRPPSSAPAASTSNSASSGFTITPRGALDIDYAAYFHRRGGYDYSNGTTVRRGRFGFVGSAPGKLEFALLAEFSGGSVSLLDAFVARRFGGNWLVTLGQHKTPQGLEANSSDSFSTFLERGMVVNVANSLGGDRRVGASLTYNGDHLHAQAGIYGTQETFDRVRLGRADETYEGAARIVWQPVNGKDRAVVVGASTFLATNLAVDETGDAVRLRDRPGTRVDGGRIIDSGPIPEVSSALYWGAEAALVRGPFSLQGEYGRVKLNRRAALSDPSFDGFYVLGSVFLTGESRTFKHGAVQRLVPRSPFAPEQGDWGAFELALRYEEMDLGQSPTLTGRGNAAHSWTLGLNWYLTGNMRLMFNWVRFEGTNTPLDPIGTRTEGDALATRLGFSF